MSKRLNKLEKLLYKLDRRDILEMTVGSASTVNLIEDLVEINRDDDESIDALIEECEEIIKSKESVYD